MGVAINTRRLAVGRPSGVRDTGVRIKDLCEVGLLLGDELLELCYLADFLERKYFILLVTINGETSRIVSAVF